MWVVEYRNEFEAWWLTLSEEQRTTYTTNTSTNFERKA